MKEQIALQKLLLNQYEARRTKNPQFSRRAFSKALGISPGALSELFAGRRRVSVKLAERVTARLSLDPQERAELFALFPKKTNAPTSSDQIDPNYLQLSADQFRVVGDWYYFAILTMMRSRGFKNKPAWIASRLGLSVSLIEDAVVRLKRLGMIQEDAKGNWIRSKSRYRTSDDVANSSVRRAHSQYLDNAKEALNLPVEARDFTSLMMSIQPEQLPKIKERIRKFQDDISAEFETAPHDEVYQMCIQLFPLTRKENEK